MKKALTFLLTVLCAVCLLMPKQAFAADSEPTPGTTEGSITREVVYDCVYFGSYPQTRVLDDGSGESSQYNRLFILSESAWDENNETVYDGVKYRRIKGNSDDDVNYFRYDPIKWRILEKDGNDAFLLADVVLDYQPYHNEVAFVDWEKASLRSWLNDDFLNTAFSEEEQAAIPETTVINKDNVRYGAGAGKGGKDTTDKVFLLSESEVYTEGAIAYGFDPSHTMDQKARRTGPSKYTLAKGIPTYTYTSGSVCFWALRSPGLNNRQISYVDTGGTVEGQSNNYYVENYYGIRPALHLNLAAGKHTTADSINIDRTQSFNQVNADTDTYYYDDTPVCPVISIPGLTQGKHYSVSYYGNDLQYGNIGTAEITGIAPYTGTLKWYFNVQRRVPLKGIAIADMNLVYGSSEKIAIEYDPATTTDDKTAAWKSDNPAIATVSTDGTVTATGVGTATITVTVGDFSDSCIVTVTKADPSYTVPKRLKATCNSPLSSVALTEGFTWMDETLSVGTADSTAKTFLATFTPEDTDNYNILDNIEIKVTVDHDWSEDYTIDIPATCTEKGQISIHCNGCEATKDIRAVKATGHNYVHHDAKAPTCTEPGWEVYDTCSKCDYTTYVEIPKTGHTIVHHEAKAPTATEPGWEAYDTCSLCDYTTFVEIPVHDHHYIPVTIPAEVGIAGLEYDKCDSCGDVIIKKILSPLNPKGTSITKLTAAKKAFTVKWKKKAYTGYQIRYSLKSSMAKAKIVTIGKAGTLSRKISKLRMKKKYYVQVRTYKTVKGKKYYSKWSAKKAVTTK